MREGKKSTSGIGDEPIVLLDQREILLHTEDGSVRQADLCERGGGDDQGKSVSEALKG